MPDNLATQTADHDRRELFRNLMARWEEDIKTLTPPEGETDDTVFMRDMLSDLISDANGEIRDLTETIGDEIDYGNAA
ncbi:MAG: hypothetical protein ACR2OV_00035 [Hyphomicrobiaceae bacterium]